MLRTICYSVIVITLLSSSPYAQSICSEAEIMAMRIEGSLAPSPATAARIADDLAAIREVEPLLRSVVPRLSWDPGELWVKLTEEAYNAFLAGTFTGLDDLNAIYGLSEMVPYSFLDQVFKVSFQDCYDMEQLAAIYEAPPEVIYAEPSYSFGDGHDITAAIVGNYTFRFAWGDCLSGCQFEHIWVYAVPNGDVILINEYGDWPLEGVITAVEEAAPQVAIVSNDPNPFNPATVITFQMRLPGSAQLTILDTAGRLVRSLAQSDFLEGVHQVTWNGRTDDGRYAPAGVYLCRIEAGGRTDSKRMLLLK